MESSVLKRNAIVIAFRYAHHGRHSSYSLVADAVKNARPGNVIYRRQILMAEWFSNFIARRQYSAARLALAFSRRLYSGKNVVHHIYPEATFVSPLTNYELERVVFTNHIPLEILHRRQDFRIRNYLEAIPRVGTSICLSSTLADEVERLRGKGRVRFIRHGVDTDFFKPAAERKGDMVLTVGSLFRNWDLWIKIAARAAALEPAIQFTVVGRPPRDLERKMKEGCRGRICIMKDISDDELLALYTRAAVLFLPLYHAAANNAIVEALACGVPVVASDLAAVRDYVPEGNCFIRGESEGAIERAAQDLVEHFRNGVVLGKSIGADNRNYAVRELSWPVIAAKTIEAYDEIL